MTPERGTDSPAALERLVRRDEVLEICFWFQGEGFGDVFAPAALLPFLTCEEGPIALALAELAEQGLLQPSGTGYRLTDDGRKNGGRLFADSFAEFQHVGHGECYAGCCDEEEQEHGHAV
jgi:hypothetical protein